MNVKSAASRHLSNYFFPQQAENFFLSMAAESNDLTLPHIVRRLRRSASSVVRIEKEQTVVYLLIYEAQNRPPSATVDFILDCTCSTPPLPPEFTNTPGMIKNRIIQDPYYTPLRCMFGRFLKIILKKKPPFSTIAIFSRESISSTIEFTSTLLRAIGKQNWSMVSVNSERWQNQVDIDL